MKSYLHVACLIIFITAISCKDEDEPMGFELLENNELEEGFSKPVGWNTVFNALDGTSIFGFDWTTEYALSGTKSLKIFIDSDNPEEFASWTTTRLLSSSEAQGEEIELSVWVKADLTGEGVILIIRADNEGEIVRQETTQFNKTISGEFDWRNVKLTTPVEEGIDSYSIFLMLSGSTNGEVYFDNVSLKLK